MPFPLSLRRAFAAAAALALAACAELTPQQPAPLLNYQPESFHASAFSRHFAATPERICEAALRVQAGLAAPRRDYAFDVKPRWPLEELSRQAAR